MKITEKKTDFPVATLRTQQEVRQAIAHRC